MVTDVCISCNACCVDEQIFALWVNGATEVDVLETVARKEEVDSSEEKGLLRAEVRDQFRQCELIERYMEQPIRLKDHCPVELRKDVAERLIEIYYDFDDAVVREFLGKKLSSRTRKDLDDVSLKTKVPVRSCRRQFDNFRRIFKNVEELSGYLTTNISNHFLLSEKLATKYAAAVFITNQRFETTKKKLQFLRFADFAYCAELMIKEWSYSSSESRTADMDVDLDKNFLQQLRGLKQLQDKETGELIKKSLMKDIQSKVEKNTLADVNLNFKNYFKNLLSLASDLYHSRDLKDFFLDVVEKFIEPWKTANWTYDEAETFFHSLKSTVPESGQNSTLQTASWDRYMRVVTASVLRIYAAVNNH